MNESIDNIADAFAEIQRHPIEPEIMVWADPPNREPGTWLFCRGCEPERIADTSEFDRVWMSALGITNKSIEENEENKKNGELL
jgi:hypothetical protein